MKWAVLALILLAGCTNAAPDAGSSDPVADEDAPGSVSAPAQVLAMDVFPGQRVVAYGEDGRGAAFTLGFILTDAAGGLYGTSVAHAMHLIDPPLPLGTPVRIEEQIIGHFVYDGWATQTDDFTTDFALIELTPQAASWVSPAVASWGGPTGIANGDAQLPGWQIFTHGATTAEGNPGRLLDEDSGFTIARFEATFKPGDSGSPVLAWDGAALGLGVAYLGLEPVGQESEKVAFIVSLDHNLGLAAEPGFDLDVVTADFEPATTPWGP